MLVVVSEDDHQVEAVLQLLKQHCFEEVVRGNNLVLQTSPGNYVRERDGSLPSRITFVGHGTKTQFGQKDANTFVENLKTQLGPPDKTPVKTLDLIGCEIGLVAFDKNKNPVIATDVRSKNYSFAQDVAEQLKALGYIIQVNVFSNLAAKETSYAMAFCREGDKFSLKNYKTQADYDLSWELWDLADEIKEVNQQIFSILQLSNDLCEAAAKGKKAANHSLASLKTLYPTLPFSTIPDAFRTFELIKEGLTQKDNELQERYAAVNARMKVTRTELTTDLRKELDSPHFKFPVAVPKVHSAATPLVSIPTVERVGAASPKVMRPVVTPVSPSPSSPTSPSFKDRLNFFKTAETKEAGDQKKEKATMLGAPRSK